VNAVATNRLYHLRRATIEDADTVSSLGARTFTETFAHLYPPEDLETFLAYAYGLERTRSSF
jgi:diamine N-acetyltransferase